MRAAPGSPGVSNHHRPLRPGRLTASLLAMLLTAACISAVDDDDTSSPVPTQPVPVSSPTPTQGPGLTSPPGDDDATPPDFDGDGYPAGEDCDDHEAAVYPGAQEVCDDVDNDCDEEIDESPPDGEALPGSPTWYPDDDGDGYGTGGADEVVACARPSGYGAATGDCDDEDPSIYPSAREQCDEVDWDCNGISTEPDGADLRADELTFGLEMVSPNLGLPIDELTCEWDEEEQAYEHNPQFWVFPQLQYGSLLSWADSETCGGGAQAPLTHQFDDGIEDDWGLYSLSLQTDFSNGCRYGGLIYTFYADLSRYSSLRIRYSLESDGPALLKVNYGNGDESFVLLPVTDGSFAEVTFSRDEFADVTWDQLNYFVFAFEADRGVVTADFVLDYLLIEATAEAYAENAVTCSEEETYPDLACFEPYTSTTNLGLAIAQLATAYTVGDLSSDAALTRAQTIISHLMDQRGWSGEAAGAPWSERGWMQTWISPFSGMPSPYDKWISLLDNANLVAGLIVADVAFAGLDPYLDAQLSTLLNDPEWYLFNDTTTQFGGYYRHEGCGLATGTWESETCPLEPYYPWVHDIVGDDKLLGSFLSYAHGAMTDDTWRELECPLDTYESPSSGDSYTWYDTGSRGFVHSDIPAMTDGGLFLPGAALIFMDSERVPVAEAFPTLADSAQQLLLAQKAYRDHYDLSYWGWSNCRDVDSCENLAGEEVTLQIVAPYGSLMLVEHAPEEVLEQACNLLESGLNGPLETGTVSREWGLRDAIAQNGHYNTAGYLFLDKAWSYLALASFQHSHVVERLFAEHPRVQYAYDGVPSLCSGPVSLE